MNDGGIMKKISNYLKRTIVIFVALVAGLVLLSAPVSAHTTENDREMSAELHVEPNDQPQSQTPTTLHFEFYDQANLFTLPRCNCQLTVQKDGASVATVPLGGNDLLMSENTFSFPTSGEYTLQVNGQPKEGSVTFQSFQLTYPLTVLEKEAVATANTKTENKQSSSGSVWIALVGIWVVVGIIVYLIIRRLMNRKKTELTSNENKEI